MLEVHPRYRAVFETLGWDSSEGVIRALQVRGEAEPARSGVHVRQATVALPDGGRLEVFFKQYLHASPSWKFVGRASKARREFQNYAIFERLGIPCADPVACGEERDFCGRLRRAFILTRAIPQASTLGEFWRELASAEPARARAIRRGLCRQLAAMTRRLHEAHVRHCDLVWRNILVTADPPSEPKLWWIDCPRGRQDRWPLGRRRHRIKDLASLDKSAVLWCRATERLAFLLAYLGKSRMDAEVKTVAKAVLRYRRRRWPDSEPVRSPGGPGAQAV